MLTDLAPLWMVGGSIPDRTQTLPLALYAAGKDHDALVFTLVLSLVAFLLLGAVGSYQTQVAGQRGEK